MALIKLNNQSLSAVTSAGMPAGAVLQVVTDADNTYHSRTTSTLTLMEIAG